MVLPLEEPEISDQSRLPRFIAQDGKQRRPNIVQRACCFRSSSAATARTPYPEEAPVLSPRVSFGYTVGKTVRDVFAVLGGIAALSFL